MKLELVPHWYWSDGEQEMTLEPVLLTLLAALNGGATLRAAAEEAGVSYRHAWGVLDHWGQRFGMPLVIKARGRGTRLTSLGEGLLNGDRLIRERLTPMLEEAAGELEQRLAALLERGRDKLLICASHDMLLSQLRTLLRQHHGVRMGLRFCGSLESLRRLRAGECDLAGFHVPDGELGQALSQHWCTLIGPASRLIWLYRRRQGLITAKGNPKKIRAISDLNRPGVRFVNRQPGSGTRLALDALLKQMRCDADAIVGYEDEEFTHSAVAALVASKAVDVAMGVEAAALRFGLDFVPLFQERYFFAVPQRKVGEPAVQSLLAELKSDSFRARAMALAGYEVSETGEMMPATALVEI